MARHLFGGRPGDYGILPPSSTAGVVKVSGRFTGGKAYDSATNGTQLTDLLPASGTTTPIALDADGFPELFYGPDGVTSLWADLGGGRRVLLEALDFDQTIAAATTSASAAQAAAASSATDAQTAQQQARDAANLVGAPAGTAMDAYLADAGGTAAALLDSAGKVKQTKQPSVFVATGGDDTAALNTFLAAASPLGVKKLIGAFTIAGALTMPLADTLLDLTAATLTTTSATASAVILSGDRSCVAGGRITSPASWDGSNPGTAWTFAVILVTGADCTVREARLTNVPRVGIGAKDTNGTTRVLDCTIEGNYPAASWTEVETNHFGIALDPGATSSKLFARGNTVRSCVQGVFLGNWGVGSSVGSIILGNTFEGCHNHAVYGSAGVTELSITSNTMTDCSRPVAVTGAGHDVSHNNMTTTLASGNLSEACGIQMRDAVDCTVSFNRMKGSVHAGSPAIDLVRTGTNTTVTGNRVAFNKVEITGTNTGIGVRVGSGVETDLHSNLVESNTIKGAGVANQGLVSFFGVTGSQGYNNKAIGNILTITGPCNGVHVSEQRGLDVLANHIRFQYDAPSATTLGAVVLTGNSTATKVRGNDIECPSTSGTNVTLRAIWEVAGTTANRIGPNRYSLDPTKLAAAVIHIIQTTSASILTEVAMTGAPTTVCGAGSTWTRLDNSGGTPSTALYVKETAASSATWRAV